MVTDESTTTKARWTVAGIFNDPTAAEQVLNDLKEADFSPDQVSVVAKDAQESRDVVENTGMGTEGAAAGTGALLGGVTGGVLGWLVGIGALAIPGIGPIVAAGALATTLGGAAVGAAAGGLVGALVGLGIPEEEARGYEDRVKAGGILVTVTVATSAEAERARAIFNEYDGTARVYST